MKFRNYEKYELINFVIVLTIVIELVFVFIIFNLKKDEYIKISGIVLKENLLVVMVDEKERKSIYSNSIVSIADSNKKYKVIEDRGVLMKRKNKKYYELVIKVDFDRKKKANDIVELSIKIKRVKLIEMFKIIWEGD